MSVVTRLSRSGETYEETVAEMKASIKSFIWDYIEEGDFIPEDDLTIASVKVAV